MYSLFTTLLFASSFKQALPQYHKWSLNGKWKWHKKQRTQKLTQSFLQTCHKHSHILPWNSAAFSPRFIPCVKNQQCKAESRIAINLLDAKCSTCDKSRLKQGLYSLFMCLNFPKYIIASMIFLYAALNYSI